MMNHLAFGFVASGMLLSALFVVRSRDLVRSVLWLAVTLLCTAALYALLDAQFLSGVQVLTYIGGVVTLMIFGVMVTRRHAARDAEAENTGSLRGALGALAFFGVVFAAIWRTDLPETESAQTTDTRAIAHSLLSEHLLAFEVLSLLLLAAIVGAVVLARRRDPVAGDERNTGTLPSIQAEIE